MVFQMMKVLIEMGLLKSGMDVTLDDGSIIRSADVLGPPSPGKKISVVWDTYDSTKMETICVNSDVMIHEGTYGQEEHQKALDHAHSTAKMAGEYASSIIKRMWLF